MADWESKGLSNEKNNPLFAENDRLSPKLAQMNNSRIKIEFKGSCFKRDKAYSKLYTPNHVPNLFIVYKLDKQSQDLNGEFTVKDCLFGAAKLTKNADPDKCSYSGYGVGFDSRSIFSI